MSFHMEGEGPAVVLLHSSMSSKNQWRSLIQHLKPRHRVIAIDLLGYGDSPIRRRGTEYRLADEVCFVERIVNGLLLPGEPYHLVGHSYGAVVALGLAEQSSRPLASLTLYEPIAAHLLPPSDPGRVEFELLEKDVRRCASADDASGGAARFIDYWSGADTFAALPEQKQRALAALLPKVLMEFHAVAVERRCNAWLGRIETPVCLMFGRHSPMPSRRVIAHLAAWMPHARCVEIDAGHMAPVTHPGLADPVIAGFIADAGDRKPEPAVRISPVVPRPEKSRCVNWAVAFAVCIAALFCAAPMTRATAADLHEAGASTWHEMPAGFPRAARWAVVSGNPHVAGPFVLRIELEPGFRLPPHRTEHDLQVVVLSGELTVGSGTVRQPASRHRMTSGYFAHFDASRAWFASSAHGATVQIFGIGPL